MEKVHKNIKLKKWKEERKEGREDNQKQNKTMKISTKTKGKNFYFTRCITSL